MTISPLATPALPMHQNLLLCWTGWNSPAKHQVPMLGAAVHKDAGHIFGDKLLST